MVREDIVAGLKNAVERGEGIETAKQSFISAGYPREEVEEASNLIQSGSALIIGRGENFPPLKIQQQVQPAETQQTEMPKEEKPLPNKLKRNFKIILLVIILLFLVGILMATILFKNEIISFLSGL